MTVTFLGTGTSQGVPVIACDCEVCRSLDYRDKRLRSSIHIAVDDLSLVVDSGPDFRQQALQAQIKSLDALLFTHEHKDHTAGMDDIRSYNFAQKMDIPIFAHSRVIQQLKREFAYVFDQPNYPGIPKVKVNEIDKAPFEIKGQKIQPVEVMHLKLPVLGFRVGDFTYITDAKTIAEEERQKIRGSKVVVLNALQKSKHYSHLTLDEALVMAEDLGAERTYFTHISHRLGTHESISKDLPEGVALAYDGLKVNI